MTDPGTHTLRDDLDLLAAHAPVGQSPPSDILVRVASRRRRAVALLTIAGGAVAVVALAAVAVVIPSLSGTTNDPDVVTRPPQAAPAAIPDSVAFDYEAACTQQDRRAERCPIDELGQQKWEEIVSAFERQLTPTRLAGSEDPDGSRSYSFTASIGTTPVSHTPHPELELEPEPEPEPTLWVEVAVPANPTPSSPSASTHPATSPDFRYGEGIVTLTQADGTEMMVRFWGAKPTDAPLEDDELDVVALFSRAVGRLSSE